MAVVFFDDFIDALVGAMARTQRTAEEYCRAVIPEIGQENAYFASDRESGQLTAKTIEINLPEAGGALSVPVLSMVPTKAPQVVDLTFEFQAFLGQLEAVQTSRGTENRLSLTFLKKRFRRAREVRIRVELRSGDPPEGRVLVNEELLREI